MVPPCSSLNESGTPVILIKPSLGHRDRFMGFSLKNNSIAADAERPKPRDLYWPQSVMPCALRSACMTLSFASGCNRASVAGSLIFCHPLTIRLPLIRTCALAFAA